MSASEVNIGWRQVLQALMVSLVIVVSDERFDLLLEIARQKIMLQQYAILQCLVPAFDLALRLRMVRCTANMAHPIVSDPVGELD